MDQVRKRGNNNNNNHNDNDNDNNNNNNDKAMNSPAICGSPACHRSHWPPAVGAPLQKPHSPEAGHSPPGAIDLGLIPVVVGGWFRVIYWETYV